MWWETLQDDTPYFGIPQVGFRGQQGNFMETALIDPDYRVPDKPALIATGRDQRIEAAMRVLMGQPGGRGRSGTLIRWQIATHHIEYRQVDPGLRWHLRPRGFGRRSGQPLARPADRVRARLGASLDVAGITRLQALQLLGGDDALKERVIAHVGKSRSARQRRRYTGDASIAARNAQLEAEVTAGLRSSESLFLLLRKQLESATFVERAPVVDSTGW